LPDTSFRGGIRLGICAPAIPAQTRTATRAHKRPMRNSLRLDGAGTAPAARMEQNAHVSLSPHAMSVRRRARSWGQTFNRLTGCAPLHTPLRAQRPRLAIRPAQAPSCPRRLARHENLQPDIFRRTPARPDRNTARGTARLPPWKEKSVTGLGLRIVPLLWPVRS